MGPSQNPIETSGTGPKSLDRSKAKRELSRYLNRAREIKSRDTDDLRGELDSLVRNFDSSREEDLRTRLEPLMQKALSLMATAVPTSDVFKLAADIRIELFKL